MSIPGGSPNILLIIVDDWGESNAEIFGSPAVTRALTNPTERILVPARRIRVVTEDPAGVLITGELPNLSLLLRNGIYFKQAWAQPACSPTRASIYTGLYP